MRWFKLAAFLFLWAVFFALVALAHLGVTLFKLPRRWEVISRLVRHFAFLLRTLLDIKVTVKGATHLLSVEGHCIIANHVSYVDGIVLGSIFPVIFVSKKEVRGWPLIGQWTALCGAIFIDRQRKDKIPLLVEEMTQKLMRGANILLFPEGTSTNGEKLLPFQSAPFAAPLRNGTTILPITVRYLTINGQPVSVVNRDLIYWYGDMDFLSHFWALLAVRNIEVSVDIHPPIESSRFRNDSAGRKQLCQACYEILSGETRTEDAVWERDENEQDDRRANLTSG